MLATICASTNGARTLSQALLGLGRLAPRPYLSSPRAAVRCSFLWRPIFGWPHISSLLAAVKKSFDALWPWFRLNAERQRDQS